MQKRTKCLISIILSLFVIFSLTVVVSAIEPRFSETNSITVRLGFSGTTADCDVTILGADGTTSIDCVNIYLKDSRNNVKGKWLNLSSPSNYFTFSDSVSDLTEGETYTLSVSAKVHRKGKTENVSDSKTSTCSSK